MCTQVDLDLGASGAIPIKGKYVITGGKQGPLYIADAMDLGGYEPLANNTNVFQVRSPLAPALLIVQHLLLCGHIRSESNLLVLACRLRRCPQLFALGEAMLGLSTEVARLLS